MRTGFTVSAIAHVGVIALVVVGIGFGKPVDSPPVESIAVDLVPIEEFSNIRVGSLESEIVETDTPSAVDSDKPAELAQPTGNTTEDQPTPEDSQQASPAPTQQTAPAPDAAEPEPAPEPEPTPPEPQARPQPTPEPTPEPTPPEPAPDEPAPVVTPEAVTPADVAPQPRVRTAAIDQKRAEFKKLQEQQEQQKEEDAKKAAEEKKKKEEEAKRKEAEEKKRIEQAKAQQDAAEKLADEVANIINTEESRGATTGEGGQATLGKETGKAARLSQSEIDGLVAQITGCLNVPAGAAEMGLKTQLQFTIDQSGAVTALPQILTAPANALEQALASAAQRAVMRCGPYSVAAGQDVRATFDPSQF